MDTYQKRYLAHQKRKKADLSPVITKKPVGYKKEKDIVMKVLESRHSQRTYNGESIEPHEIEYIKRAIDLTPSSCDRKGVKVIEITDREDKEILSGLLVGGTGWIYRADTILLLVADMEAYKSPAEKGFMPYLDAGALIQSIYLASEVLNIGCAYVNPNIREKNKDFFKKRITDKLFCGAIALGKY